MAAIENQSIIEYSQLGTHSSTGNNPFAFVVSARPEATLSGSTLS
jgi:hypothetical protein